MNAISPNASPAALWAGNPQGVNPLLTALAGRPSGPPPGPAQPLSPAMLALANQELAAAQARGLGAYGYAVAGSPAALGQAAGTVPGWDQLAAQSQGAAPAQSSAPPVAAPVQSAVQTSVPTPHLAGSVATQGTLAPPTNVQQYAALGRAPGTASAGGGVGRAASSAAPPATASANAGAPPAYTGYGSTGNYGYPPVGGAPAAPAPVPAQSSAPPAPVSPAQSSAPRASAPKPPGNPNSMATRNPQDVLQKRNPLLGSIASS